MKILKIESEYIDKFSKSEKHRINNMKWNNKSLKELSLIMLDFYIFSYNLNAK
jgi:hypothetical protein